jgi:hypothetical protein
MTYAYRDDGHSITLFVSEAKRRVPSGFKRCTRARFVEAWRQRDAQQIQAMRDRPRETRRK